MGRKIPGRKHHGVRDPEKQQQQRNELLKNKINAPPTNSEDQQIPKSLSRIIALKDKVKSGTISLKRIRKRSKGLKPITSHPHGVKPPREGEKPEPVFQQDKNESDERFMHRVNRVCHNIILESKFEDKYGVDIKRNTLTGEVEVVKRKKDEIEEYHKKVKKETNNNNKGKKKKKKNDIIKLSKSQKRAVKIKAKKEKKENINYDEFKSFEDKVKFGEVVHGPPSLVLPRKGGNTEETHRPGMKNLLLKENLKLSVDRKGKRKDLPTATRRQLDLQQKEVIEAYKLLKSKRRVK
nr:uncharacterized protein LOC111415839 [Onthophagus taurus]